jgi:restriction endonuclease S subunit
MPDYKCTKCHKEFKQKIDLNRHLDKKYPCITQEEQKYTENESLSQLDAFFGKMRNLLRDNENITGSKALDVITDFLLLKFLCNDNNSDGKNYIEIFVKPNYKNKIVVDGYKEPFDLNEHKKFFSWKAIMKLLNEIEKTKDNTEKQEKLEYILVLISNIIFGGLFRYNEQTKEIYKNKKFIVQKRLTIIRLLKEFDKINFDDHDVDVKGKAYELTIQKEGATNKDFSQFFTPRWIDKYMVDNVDIEINKKGEYTKILDPACGTAGILSSYIVKVNQIANDKDILLDKDVEKFMFGYEIVDDTIRIAHMNILLQSEKYNKNIKCVDFLENGCLNFTKDKFDGNIITNPPFALTKTYDEIFKYEDVFPVKTKSGSMLFLQACVNSLKKGRKCIMVLPNGKEIFGTNKEFVDIRQNMLENNNVYKISLLPSQSFKPYTGVETLVLMIKKGEKTKEIEFVNVIKNKDKSTSETKLCKVKIDELKGKKYSWNYKDYIEELVEEYGDVKYEKIKDILDIEQGKSLTKNNMINGKYKVIGGGKIIGTHNEKNRNGNEIVLTRVGEMTINYLNEKYYLTENGFAIKSKVDNILTKYIYYILCCKNNIYELYKGSSQKVITKGNLEKIKIPIPSLDVQKLIIKELDILYNQKKRLEKMNSDMNETKKIKFEILLNECKNVKKYKLKEIIYFEQKKMKLRAADGNVDGKYRFFTSSQDKLLFRDDYEFENKCIIIGRGGNASIHISQKFGVSYDDCYVISVNKDNTHSIDYVYDYLAAHKKIIEAGFTGATIKHISKNYIENINIQIPSKDDQKLIIKEMKKNDELEKINSEQIKELNELIKKRFEYHLKKCEEKTDESDSSNESENDDDSSSDSGSDEDEKPKKVIKKIVNESVNNRFIKT